MSVVNQMLKDLEQQQADKRLQFDEADLEVITPDSPSRSTFTLKLILPITLILVGIASWILFSDPFSFTTKVTAQRELISDVSGNAPIDNDALEEMTLEVSSEGGASAPSKLSDHPIKSESIINGENTKVSNPQIAITKTPDVVDLTEKSELDEANVASTPTIVNKQAAANQSAIQSSKAEGEVTVLRGNEAAGNEAVVTTDEAIQKHAITDRVTDSESTSKPVTTRDVVKEVSQAQQKSARLEQARQWISLGDFSRAEQLLIELLSDFNDFHVAREQLAYVYLQTQNNGALEELLKNALEAYPQHITYRVLLARQYADVKDWNAVIALTLTNVVTDERLLLMRALAFQQLKQHEKAVEVYIELLRHQSTRGDWWIGFAVSLESLNRFRDAHQALSRATQDPRLTQQQRQYIQTKQRTLKGLF